MNKTLKIITLFSVFVIVGILFFKHGWRTRGSVPVGETEMISNTDNFLSSIDEISETTASNVSEEETVPSEKPSPTVTLQDDELFEDIADRTVEEITSKWSWPSADEMKNFKETENVTAALKKMRSNLTRFKTCSGKITREITRGNFKYKMDGTFVAKAGGEFRTESISVEPKSVQGAEEVIVYDGLVCRFEIRDKSGATSKNEFTFSVCPFFTNADVLKKVPWKHQGKDIINFNNKEGRIEEKEVHVLISNDGLKRIFIDTVSGNLLRREEVTTTGDVASATDFLEYEKTKDNISYATQLRLTDTEKIVRISFTDIKFDIPIIKKEFFNSMDILFDKEYPSNGKEQI